MRRRGKPALGGGWRRQRGRGRARSRWAAASPAAAQATELLFVRDVLGPLRARPGPAPEEPSPDTFLVALDAELSVLFPCRRQRCHVPRASCGLLCRLTRW